MVEPSGGQDAVGDFIQASQHKKDEDGRRKALLMTGEGAQGA
jgi:hypothetical protein